MQETNALPTLDARLAAAAAFVPNGCVAADIGCDHGKLSAVLSQKCKKVIAVDSRKAPLESAKEQMRKSGALNVECRLGSGLSAVNENEAGAIIVAGLSAKTIIDILAAAPWIKAGECRLILVPATKPHELRAWLYKNGFELCGDAAVKAAGRCYAVMCAQYSGKVKDITPLESIVGNITGEHRAEYLKKEAGKLAKASLGKGFAHYKELSRLVLLEAEKC